MTPTMPSPLRAVVVDGRPERRAVMSRLVDGDGARTSVVGEADGWEAAVAVVDAQRGDVAIVEIGMPSAAGHRTIRELHRSFPRLGIVACAFDIDHATELDALAAGAHACVPKPLSRRALQGAIEAAYVSAVDSDNPIAAGAPTSS